MLHARTAEDVIEGLYEGESLQDLMALMAAAGYGGAPVKVTDDAGWTKGWVSATCCRST